MEPVKSTERLNVPDTVLEITKKNEVTPTHGLESETEGNAEYRKQEAGIRPCPLSLYMFVMLMTVLFHDVRNEVDRKVQVGALDNINLWDLFLQAML